jgi:protein-tyrosine-phosphatase
MATRTKVLFLCIGNACRSQMAEAIARHIAADVIEPSSAGLAAFGEITRLTLTALAEHGIPADGQRSKCLRPEEMAAADLVINMTGRASDSIFDAPTGPVEDWDVGDPFGSNLAVYRAIRDQIEVLVEGLARRLRNQVDAEKKA